MTTTNKLPIFEHNNALVNFDTYMTSCNLISDMYEHGYEFTNILIAKKIIDDDELKYIIRVNKVIDNSHIMNIEFDCINTIHGVDIYINTDYDTELVNGRIILYDEMSDEQIQNSVIDILCQI